MTEKPVANPKDWRETRTPEEAAAETEEPEAAARVRAEDDAATRARQAEAEAGLREADRTLEDGGARLQRTREELRRREMELERTSDLTREVARNAASLLEQTEQIAERARRTPGSEPDASSGGHQSQP
jgi:archaellum component FlaC